LNPLSKLMTRIKNRGRSKKGAAQPSSPDALDPSTLGDTLRDPLASGQAAAGSGSVLPPSGGWSGAKGGASASSGPRIGTGRSKPVASPLRQSSGDDYALAGGTTGDSDTYVLNDGGGSGYLQPESESEEYAVTEQTSPLRDGGDEVYTLNEGGSNHYLLENDGSSPYESALTGESQKSDYLLENDGDSSTYESALTGENQKSDYLVENDGSSTYESALTGENQKSDYLHEREEYTLGGGADTSHYLNNTLGGGDDTSHYENPTLGGGGDTSHYLNNTLRGGDDTSHYLRAMNGDELDYSVDDSGGEQESSEQEEEVVPELTERERWHQRQKGSLLTKSLDDEYVGEETRSSKADGIGHLPQNLFGAQAIGTHYANNGDEFGTSAQNGKLTRGGGVVSSTDSTAKVNGKVEQANGNRRIYNKDVDERVNFALDGAGGLYTSDPRAETRKHLDKQNKTVIRHNHSSLVGGGDVAAAGTMKVRDGQVEEVGDGSGHYKLSMVHTAQAVDHLQKQGVMDQDRSTVRLEGKDQGQKAVLMSGQEFSGYEGQIAQAREQFQRTGDKTALDRPEQTVRKLHGAKDNMLNELRSKRPTGDDDGQNLLPSAIRGKVNTPKVDPRAERKKKAEESRRMREQERQERGERRNKK